MARYMPPLPRGNGSTDLSHYGDRLRAKYPGSERYARRIAERTRHAAMSARDTEEYHDLGEMMLDTVERYFPEEYQARRRDAMMKAFGAGVVVGAAGVAYLSRMRR